MWTCSCGKEHEDTFDSCWSCGKERGSGPVGVLSEDPSDAATRPGEGIAEDEEYGGLATGRTVTLKEETILNQWSMLIDRAAPHAAEVLEELDRRLEEAQIPGGCTWSLSEVKSSGWFSRVRREFLIIRLEQFSDYRMYIAAREYGIHLDVCRFLTVEPGFFKRQLAERLVGSKEAFSAPKNILIEQDLRAWTTTVHHAVLEAVGSLMDKLGQDKSQIRRESKGFLEVW